MSEIINMAETLNRKILESDAYLEYKDAHKKLCEQKDTYKKVSDFRVQMFDDGFEELNRASSDNEKDLHLSSIYSDLIMIDVARDFFEKESEFLDLLNEVSEIITLNIDVDMFKLDI